MADKRIRIGAGQGRGLWPVLLVLLLAVIVPTACVLWFMNAAMRNERLAVRQKLTNIYRQRAADARVALETFWSAKADALQAARQLPPWQLFARGVESGLAESLIVYDEAGGVRYPDTHRPAPIKLPVDSPQRLQARKLEYDLAEHVEAANLYARIASGAGDINLQALALQGQARCLLKAGRKQQALEILTGPLAEAKLRNAADARGRLVAPSALLLALQLLEDPSEAVFRKLADKLTEQLNDYSHAAMPSSQRRFLMRMLREIDPAAGDLPTLTAEELAAEYLQSPQPTPNELGLSETHLPGIWHLASRDGTIVALFSEQRLIAEMIAAAGLDEPFAGASFQLAPLRSARPRPDVFLAIPAGRQLPGWQLQVVIAGESPFAAAAGRQRTVYLWTATLGILIIALLALAVARYLGRQMKLTQLKSDLIATVSHELKTPLSSMRVLIDTLLSGRCGEARQGQEYLQLIARENARLSRLIDNFLTFSRMERNKGAFEFAEVDVSEIVTTAVESVRDRFTAPACRLEVDVSPDLPRINADRDAVVTVLLNLMDNAWKYSGQQKHIAIRGRAEGHHVRLEVTDNGIGMSRRAMRKIFDRFYQVDRSLSRPAGGCGLGLSIVKFIIDAHGGSIHVTSQVGKGSTFTVTLPIKKTAAAGKGEND